MVTGNVQLHHIAKAVGFTVDGLIDVSRNPGVWFHPSFKKKVGKKRREIDPPTREGKRWLKRLARFLADELPVHACAHGSVKDRCSFSAANNHLGNRPILTRDAQNCFPSVDPARFLQELLALGFQHDVAIILTRILTYRGRLPQGSPASNAALNLFFYRTDEMVRAAAAKFGGRYSRYCDDLVISVAYIEDATKAAELLEKSIAFLGLTVNAKKRAENGFQDLTVERSVNGVRVDSPHGTQLPSDVEQDILTLSKRYELSAQSCNLGALATLAGRRRRLQGLLNYASQARLSRVGEVLHCFHEGDRFVIRNLTKYGITIKPENWWAKNQYLDNARSIKDAILRKRAVSCSAGQDANE